MRISYELDRLVEQEKQRLQTLKDEELVYMLEAYSIRGVSLELAIGEIRRRPKLHTRLLEEIPEYFI